MQHIANVSKAEIRERCLWGKIAQNKILKMVSKLPR